MDNQARSKQLKTFLGCKNRGHFASLGFEKSVDNVDKRVDKFGFHMKMAFYQ
ncbi:hypothetical protein ABH897_002280 [Paenibacillus sp. RC73]|uniref:hypothetical protein n=1 Tax=unclassified Paenibacillus TaxID=185978 RepID=UPI00383851DA